MRVLLLGLLALAAAAGLALASNLFDEDLSPEAQALLAAPAVATPPERNGYFQLVGLLAPEDEDAYAWGRKYVRVLAEADQFGDFESAEYRKLAGATKAPRAKPPCDALFGGKNDCVTLATARRDRLEAWSAEHAEPLRRYRALREFPAIEEAFFPLRSDSLVAAYQRLAPVQRAVLARAAALATDGRGAEAIEELAGELAMGRRLLEGSRSRATRMIAVGQLVRATMMLSALLHDHPAALSPFLPRLAQLVRPLSAVETDAARALRADLRATARLLSTPMALQRMAEDPLFGGPSLGFLYRPNATVNLYAQLGAQVLEYAKAPPAELAAREAALQGEIDAQTALCCSPFNPAGRAVARAMLADHDRLMKRVYDLDGLLRLVALQGRLMASGAADAEVAKVLAQGGKELANPYTGRPMQWDPASRQLWFQPAMHAPWHYERFGRGKGRLAVTLP